MSAEELTSAERRRERAGSFGPAAETYDRVRPDYPKSAVAWALEPLGPGSWSVADIGAGTGIMSRRLCSLNHRVIAVEPDPRMRSRLVATTAGVRAVAGTSEAIPLPDGAVDAAVAAQAYHWFDPIRAHAELARVVRPGGVFAAVWNIRDESVDWLARYSQIAEGRRDAEGRADAAHDQALSFGDAFTPVERAEFRHYATVTVDDLVALAQTRSYYITAAPDEQAWLVLAVRDLVATHPDVAGRNEFTIAYITEVFRAQRR